MTRTFGFRAGAADKGETAPSRKNCLLSTSISSPGYDDIPEIAQLSATADRPFASKDQLHADLDVPWADLGRADAAERAGRKVGVGVAEHNPVERVLHLHSHLV